MTTGLGKRDGKLAKVSVDLEMSQSSLNGARQEIESLEGRIRDFKSETARLEDQLADRVAEGRQLKGSLEAANRDLAEARDEMAVMKARIEGFESTKGELAAEARDLASVRDELGELTATQDWMEPHPALSLIPYRHFRGEGAAFLVQRRGDDAARKTGGEA